MTRALTALLLAVAGLGVMLAGIGCGQKQDETPAAAPPPPPPPPPGG